LKQTIKRSYRITKYVVYRQTIVNPTDHLWTFIGAFIGIGLIGWVQRFQLAEQDNVFLIGSFGASAVLVFGATNSPLMQITKTMHPPGGATALIANIGSEKIKALGFVYVLSPVTTGILILLAVALIVNNIPKNRNYPYKKIRFRKR